MSLPARFNQDLCKKLNQGKKLNQVMPGYTWQAELRIGGGSREAVDVGRRPPKGSRLRPVLIEVELRREDPASNILKVWNRFLDGAYPHGVVLLQGFSQVYSSRKYHNRSLKAKVAKRLGRVVQESTKGRFRYIALDIPYHPRAGSNEGDGARRNAAQWLGDKVAALQRRKRFE
ncbi:MAG: hypothetical protein LAN83_09395 [Acidobacteriia bacterium]|nr:hypothetical protein [Terriglobia bacterium]